MKTPQLTFSLLLIILFPALTLAPATRIYKASQRPHTVVTPVTFNVPGLNQVGSFAAANQGPYRVTSFRHPHCRGTIALLPLYRNAEGSAVLTRLFDNPELRYGIIFSGGIYAEFPQLLYTLTIFQERAFRGLPFSGEKKQPYAFAEQGDCALAEHAALRLREI